MSTSPSPQAAAEYSSLTVDIGPQDYMMINISPSNHPASIRNIVIAGETGVGKSSLINLITGQELAATSNNALGVTRSTEYHDWINDNQRFRLWDTPGLSEGTKGAVPPKQAQDALRSLLTELTKGDGVHLLVICMRGLPGGVTKFMKHIYDTIVQMRNRVNPTIPIAAVITELEKRSSLPDIILSMNTWWTNHVAELTEYNMAFSAHACITTLLDSDYPRLPGRRTLCQDLVRKLIAEGISPKIPRNIVVVGALGVGKSSLVNLVLGSDRAFVQNNIAPVTTKTSEYDWEASSGEIFRLWDTPGLGEGVPSTGPQKRAQAVESLFVDLSKRGGVHLIIVCISGLSKGSVAMKRTYDLIMKMRNQASSTIPVAAVITELEGRSTTIDTAHSSMDQWWTANLNALSDHDMSFSGHACITTLRDDCHPAVPGRRELCQGLARDLIMTHSLHPQTVPPKDLHVLLFGETGVGKSSLINLLAGWEIASVSRDSMPCTLDSTEYQFQLGSTTIRLWDTLGLEGPEKQPTNYVDAIEKAVQLIRRLDATGGISLLLFCIRGNRITKTTQGNYRLFYEVLGKKEVPIALAVTHLEGEVDMEDWWQRNSKQLENGGIRTAGHACITTLKSDPKYHKSKDIVRDLLSRFEHQGKFSMPSEAWMEHILKGLKLLVEKSFPRGKDLVQVLTRRCFLDPDVAQQVAARIDLGA